MRKVLLVGGLAAIVAFSAGCKKTKELVSVEKPAAVVQEETVDVKALVDEDFNLEDAQYLRLDYALFLCRRPIRVIETDYSLVLQAAAPAEREWKGYEPGLKVNKSYEIESLSFYYPPDELEAIVLYNPTILAPVGYEDAHTFHFELIKKDNS